MFAIGGDTPQYAARNLVDVVSRDHDNGTYYDDGGPRGPTPWPCARRFSGACTR